MNNDVLIQLDELIDIYSINKDSLELLKYANEHNLFLDYDTLMIKCNNGRWLNYDEIKETYHEDLISTNPEIKINSFRFATEVRDTSKTNISIWNDVETDGWFVAMIECKDGFAPKRTEYTTSLDEIKKCMYKNAIFGTLYKPLKIEYNEPIETSVAYIN